MPKTGCPIATLKFGPCGSPKRQLSESGQILPPDCAVQVLLGMKNTLERTARLQRQVTPLRQVESNPTNYHLSVSGFLTKIDRMNLEVREYLSCHPSEVQSTQAERYPYLFKCPRWSCIHFIQEDNPHLIGTELAKWYTSP